MSNKKRSRNEFDSQHTSPPPSNPPKKRKITIKNITIKIFGYLQSSFKAGITISTSNTINQLKQKVLSESGKSLTKQPNEIAVVYNGKQLDNNSKICEFITDESTVNMTLINVSGFDITLTTRYDQTFSIGNIEQTCTFYQLKQKICNEYGIDINKQIICDKTSKQPFDDTSLVSLSPIQSFYLIITNNTQQMLQYIYNNNLINMLHKPIEFTEIKLIGIAIGNKYAFWNCGQLYDDDRPIIKLHIKSKYMRIIFKDYNDKRNVCIDMNDIYGVYICDNDSLYDMNELNINTNA
eukprot:422421_1